MPLNVRRRDICHVVKASNVHGVRYVPRRFTRLKVVLTKYHEEVTSVKKSVTQVKVETAGKKLAVDGSPIIELTPEATVVERTSPTAPTRKSPVRQKEAMPALAARAGEVNDVVDLHRSSNRTDLTHATYTAKGPLRGDHLRERYGGGTALGPEDRFVRNQSLTPNDQAGASTQVINDQRNVRQDLRVRRFIATQEMIEHQIRIERRAAIDIEV